MQRRNFLKLSALGLLPLLRCGDSATNTRQQPRSLDIVVSSDMATAHLVFQSKGWPKQHTPISTETLVVGGGIAGVTAAYKLRDTDFMLCELSQNLGGSSGAVQHGGYLICQGAHYELVYPDYFGNRPIKLLEELGLVSFDQTKSVWTFSDSKYLIHWDSETRCLDGNTYRDRVLREGKELEQFEAIINPFIGHLKLPTVDISSDYHHLNELTFAQYLKEQGLPLSQHFTTPVSYQMRDDWGGDIGQVSALAGAYYYGARPSGETHNQIISAPEGNYYFLRKMLGHIPQKKIRTQHLVKKITKTAEGYRSEILDIQSKSVLEVDSKRIVYAGHKHALKHVYSKAYPLFADQEYAPWLVVNLVMRNDEITNRFWQNESLPNSPETRYIGFVDSDLQYLDTSDTRVFTAYYCFKSEERRLLRDIEQYKDALVHETIGHIEHYLEQAVEPYVEKVYLKVMGHAMAIPKPGFLLRNITSIPDEPDFAFAGVDGGRLPLMLEAMDSGILAVSQWSNT